MGAFLSGLGARLILIVLLLGNVIVLGFWIKWQWSYPRAESVLYVWIPTTIVVWALGFGALVAADKPKLGLAYFLSVPLVSISIAAVAFFSLSTEGDFGLAVMIILLAIFDIGIIRVLHELLGSTRPS